LKTKLYKR